MTVAAAVYYIGAGVFNFGEGPDNKDYKYGEKLPAGVPAETLKSMRAKGKVSDTPPANEKATADELGALRDKVRELTAQLTTATSERDKASDAADRASQAASAGSVEIGRLQGEVSEVRNQLATVTGERDQAAEALKQAQATISEMSAAALSPAPAATAEAGPAKK